jgi:hypothetical protein
VGHHEEISPAGCRVNPRQRYGSRGGTALSLLGLLALGSGCDGETTVLPAPIFAQEGEVRADVEVPLMGGEGRLEGTLVWHSDGRWVLVERIYYRDVLGEEVVRRSRTNPGERAPEYASWVTQLNQTPGLRLPGEVAQGGPTSCPEGAARVTFTMVDTFREEVATWQRCASGNLFSVTPGSAGPDGGAARVVTAIQLTRSFTIGDQERSVFEGSVPFATLERGVDGAGREGASQAFVSEDGSEPEGWQEFWSRHAGEGVPPPEIDWGKEMVLFATTGRRDEAGHQVRVRRVLPVGVSTQVQAVEEVPGDFCAPASLERYPFHLVKAPLGPLPVVFADLLPQRIACGT